VSVISESVTIYPAPVADFLLLRVEPALAAVELAAGRPHLLVATAGTVQVDDGSGPQEITQGDAVFIAAGPAPVQVLGPGIAFVATVNAATG
jgi:mannose-6-phosphate isomerase class I